jgi:glycosyltransferase involved in cell wall biosynthesis
MVKKPFVSVVTPVHNGEKHIAEAIESVLTQTYPFDEYIIVENCSTDRTPEIVHSYASKDRRIRILQNKELLPFSDNHNLALRQVSDSSNYCKVLHADDKLFPRCLEAMVDLAERYPSTGIISSYRINGNRVDLDSIPYPEEFLTGRKVCRRSLMVANFYVFGTPSTLLLRSDIVRRTDPFYAPRWSGDLEACYNVLQDSDFGFVHQVLSFTRLHEESLTTSVEWLGSNLLGNLGALVRYGNFYLSPEEYQASMKRRLYVYYRFLGISLLQIRKRNFWKYQEDSLSGLGLSLDKMRVFLSSLSVALMNLTRPSQYRMAYKQWFEKS